MVAYSSDDATSGKGAASAVRYSAAELSEDVTFGSSRSLASPPDDAKPSAMASSWRDGTKPSGVLPSPVGDTRLVTLWTPGVAASAAVASRTWPSDAGDRRSVPGPASITPLTGMILPLPR